MIEVASRSWYWLVSSADPSAQNLMTLAACIVLYSAFLSRGRNQPHVRTRWAGRCPDSILRGGGY